jgi:hypothetical protein
MAHCPAEGGPSTHDEEGSDGHAVDGKAADEMDDHGFGKRALGLSEDGQNGSDWGSRPWEESGTGFARQLNGPPEESSDGPESDGNGAGDHGFAPKASDLNGVWDFSPLVEEMWSGHARTLNLNGPP